MFRGVPGRVDNAASPVTYLQHVAVVEWDELEANVRSASQMQGCIRRGRKRAGARLVISMVVGVDDMTDHHRVVLDLVDVALGIALRVDDRTKPKAGAADYVGGTGAVFVEYLTEVHFSFVLLDEQLNVGFAGEVQERWRPGELAPVDQILFRDTHHVKRGVARVHPDTKLLCDVEDFRSTGMVAIEFSATTRFPR
ncbi:MAG: hypothetical protein M3456_02235 [Actinomycetota bacterium]|nr:hypothetical protein [Actinomycetota bacterium]